MRILIVRLMKNNEGWQKPEWVEINSFEEIDDYKAKGYDIIKVEGDEDARRDADNVDGSSREHS